MKYEDNIYDKYVEFCSKAISDDKEFSNFKRNPDYQQILEHVSENLGRYYFSLVKNEDFSKYKDEIGNPIKYNYNGKLLSPTTIRYVSIGREIGRNFNSLDGLRVAEIGIGYGGQYLVLDKMFKMKKYTMIDLPVVCKLSEKYISNYKTNSEYEVGVLDDIEGEFDFIISNYAFSELIREKQNKYMDKIIKNTPKGFMILNSFGWYSREDLLRDIPGSSIKPHNKAEKGNHLMTWGNSNNILSL